MTFECKDVPSGISWWVANGINGGLHPIATATSSYNHAILTPESPDPRVPRVSCNVILQSCNPDPLTFFTTQSKVPTIKGSMIIGRGGVVVERIAIR